MTDKNETGHRKIADILGENEPRADINDLKSPKVTADLSDLLDDEDSMIDENISQDEAISAEMVTELRRELHIAQEALKRATENNLRTQADMQNLARRTERDIANAHKFGLEKFINELLPIVDSLDRALMVEIPDDQVAKSMFEGMELTMKQFLDVLAKHNVKQLNPKFEKFNPEFHEAISMAEGSDNPPNTIIDVLQKGYVLYDRLIRPAMVVVAK